MKDCYRILGVSREESLSGLREAYRQLARRYHPDRAGPEATATFRAIAEAYQVLCDAERRARHDQALREAEGRLDVAPNTIVRTADVPAEPLAPEPISILHGFEHVHPSSAALLDRVLHNAIADRASKAERLQALDVEVVLSPAEATRGGTIRLGVPVFRTCPHCKGTGGAWLYPCPACDDQGVVEAEASVGVHIRPHVRDGAILEVPLHGVGIHNLYLRLQLRVDPGL